MQKMRSALKNIGWLAIGLILSSCVQSRFNGTIPAGQPLLSYADLMNNKQTYDGHTVYLKAFYVRLDDSVKLNITNFLAGPGPADGTNDCRPSNLGSFIVDTKSIARLSEHPSKPNNDQVFAREMVVKGTFSAKPTERWLGMMTSFDASLIDAEIISASPTSNWCTFSWE